VLQDLLAEERRKNREIERNRRNQQEDFRVIDTPEARSHKILATVRR
jgi:hypothetical protein